MTKALRAVALLLAAMPALAVAVAPLHLWWGQLAIGDGFAYPLIAWNIVHGVGQTYDGIIPTNGFHPLWMLLHLPLQLGAAAPMERVWAVKILVAATTVGAVGAWGRVLQRAAGDEWAGLVMAAWLGASGWTLYVLFSGIEAPLVVLMMGLAVLAAWRTQAAPSPGNAALLGLTMGLCFLARLDAFFFLGPLALLVLPALSRGGARSVGAALGVGLAVSLPYLVYNRVCFGGILPVSGLVKTRETVSLAASIEVLEGAVHRLTLLVPPALGAWMPALLGVGALLGVAGVVWVFLRRPGEARLLVALPIGAALHFVYYFVFIREILVPWHLYPQVLVVFATLALALPRRHRQGVAALWLAVLVLSTAGYAAMKQARRVDLERSRVATAWVGALPAGTRAAMIDGWAVQMRLAPGHHVVELTGLVTDRPSALLARDERYAEIADVHDIVYVVGFAELLEGFDRFEVVEQADVHWNHRMRTLVLARRRQ
ncbi:MAG: hypothetical protein ABIO70_36585 [Pseudomonadota bacterium]